VLLRFVDIGVIVDHSYIFLICDLVPGQVTGLRKKNPFHIGVSFSGTLQNTRPPVFKHAYS
jgi:hypothetical protein